MNDEIAVLHGNYFENGGGEHVAETLAKTFDAPLYYGFGDQEVVPENGVEHHKLFSPTLIGKKLVRRIYQYRDLRFMWDGTHIPEIFDYDILIESGNEFGWYVPKKLDQTIIKYVHSPPRGPYDMHYKHGDSRIHRLYSMAAKTLYGHTTEYVDEYIANSEVVAKRCQKAWGVTPKIVYPPVAVHEYGQEHAEKERERTYLTFSRLYRHKRTKEIVEAFNGTERRLIVGGDGPQREAIEQIADENINIRGYLSEAEKKQLLAEVDALLFNAENEDFGIVPIEAFASGTPVIGINDGFTEYQIEDGVNGYTYDDGDPWSINNGVDAYENDGIEWESDELEAFAEQFSRERFQREMREVVEKTHNTVDIDPKVSMDAE